MNDSSSLNLTVSRVLSTYALLVFVLLWVGFTIALIANREWLDLFWIWVQGLPLVLKIIVWVVFLPVMVSLWIWESTWPILLRLAGFVGIGVWTLLAVYSFIKYWR